MTGFRPALPPSPDHDPGGDTIGDRLERCAQLVEALRRRIATGQAIDPAVLDLAAGLRTEALAVTDRC